MIWTSELPSELPSESVQVELVHIEDEIDCDNFKLNTPIGDT